MTNRIKAGDRIIVTAGQFKGKTGTVETRRSTAWVIVFDQKAGSAQLLASQLKKVTA